MNNQGQVPFNNRGNAPRAPINQPVPPVMMQPIGGIPQPGMMVAPIAVINTAGMEGP